MFAEGNPGIEGDPGGGVGLEVMIYFRLLIGRSELILREAGDRTVWLCIGQGPELFGFCNVM